MHIGNVLEIWRFPVKSMAGERVDHTTVGERGIHGDRLWAVRDVDKNVITNAKSIPGLLMCRARFVDEPAPDVGPGSVPAVEIVLPDGTSVRSTDSDVDARLSDALGRRVTLCALREASDREHYRGVKSNGSEWRAQFAVDDGAALPDFSMMPLGKLLELGKYATPPGTYFDAMTLHVVTTASLGTFDRRRFRANIVVDTGDARGYLEQTWSGATLAAGAMEALIECPTPRCSMPTRAQPDVPADKTVLKTLARDADRCLGAYASVARSGALRVGDEVTLRMPESSKLGDWARARANGLKRVLLRAALPK
ncbi:MAG TPA: MOSC N-terminal beta barrel domain-containing protein [Kofleriaceae bacterium]|nr:MOSC N-terminal beta barrel domain-containing protein [Kofleriaceae bacterium]